MINLKQAFADIKLAFATLDSDLPERLSEPGSAEQIDAFEQETEMRLPDAVRELYSLADGCTEEDGIFGGWVWLRLELMAEHLAELKISLEVDCPEEAEAKSLIPLFQHNNEDYLCIRQQEDSGRLYYVSGDNPVIEPVIDSLTDFLVQLAARIADGALVLHQYNTRFGTNFSVRPPTREYWPPDFD